MTRDWFITPEKFNCQIFEHTSQMEPEDIRVVALVATREEAESHGLVHAQAE